MSPSTCLVGDILSGSLQCTCPTSQLASMYLHTTSSVLVASVIPSTDLSANDIVFREFLGEGRVRGHSNLSLENSQQQGTTSSISLNMFMFLQRLL